MESENDFVELVPQDTTRVPHLENHGIQMRNYDSSFSTPQLLTSDGPRTYQPSKFGASTFHDMEHRMSQRLYNNQYIESDFQTPYKSNYLQERSVTKSVSQAPYHTSLVVDEHMSHTSLQHISHHAPMTPCNDFSRATQCQDLFAAKNDIIEQKDMIMQKQKLIINQLRQTNVELEELLMRNQHDSGTNHLHTREYKIQIAQLKQQLEGVCKKEEVDRLQRKLGECEYELNRTTAALREMQGDKTTDSQHTLEKLEYKTNQLSDEQRKSELLLLEVQNLKKENRKLQMYMESLATAEEFDALQKEVKKLRLENTEANKVKESMVKNEKCQREAVQKKDDEFKKLTVEIERLSKEKQRLTESLKDGGASVHEIEELRSYNKKLDQENNKLKQAVEKRHKKLNMLHYEYVGKQKEFEQEKIALEETIKTLEEEIKTKDVSITKVTATNQNLLQDSLDYQTQLKKINNQFTEEYVRNFTSLFHEMCKCISDLHSFVKLCVSRMKGMDPDLNALLGLNDSLDKMTTTSVDQLPSLHTIQQQLRDVFDAQKEIDQLRQFVSEQYAQEIGNNMCVTQ